MLEAAANGRMRFVAADRGESFEEAAAETFDLPGGMDPHKGVYNRIVQQFNNGEPLPVTMTTFSDLPAGSGLRFSPTMVVSMLKAFTKYLGLPLGEYDVADLTFQIEHVDACLNGGKQDQYAATFGGFNFIEFRDNNRAIVNPLRIKNWFISELESSLVLHYTVVSRSAATIIDQQSANMRARNEESIAAMRAARRNAGTCLAIALQATDDVARFGNVTVAAGRVHQRRLLHRHRHAGELLPSPGRVGGTVR